MRLSFIFIFLVALTSRCLAQCTLNVNLSSSAQAICSGNSVTITATASAGTSPYKYLWNTGETNASISVNKAGTYSVTVTDNTAGCTGVSKSITLTASTTPATPTASDVSICSNTSATLTATAPGGFYQWYDAPSGGNLVGSGSSYTTPVLTSGRTYYVETTINACTSLRRAVNVNVTNPINTADAFICPNGTATLNAAGATSYQWFDAPTGGNLLSSTSSYTTPPLTTTTTYYVVGTTSTCTSTRAPATVHIIAAPQAPTAASVSICTGSSATLSATAPTGVTFDWYSVTTGGTSLITSPDFTTPALTATTTYYVQASNGSCVSPRTAVTVTVNAIPPNPTANGVTICPGNSATLTASADGTSHQWYSTAGSQTVLFTGDVFQTPVLTKTKTYYVRSLNGGCVSGRTAVTVTVNPVLPAPSASGQIICTGNTATLTARTQQGTVEWYDAQTGGTLLSTSFTFTTPALTANTTYYVQAVQNGCSSTRVAVQVTITALPQAPTASGQTICAGSNTTLTASGSTGNYQWYDAVTGGNLLSVNQSYATPALTATTTYYVQAINSGGCASSRTAVTVIVTPYPAGPSANGVTTCQGSTATLTASAASGTIVWFDASSGGNQLATGSSFTTPSLQGNTTYYVESQNGQCSSARTAVTVTVTPIPDPLFKYSSGTYCTSAPNPTPTIYAPNGGTFSSTPAGLAINPTTGQIDLSASNVNYYLVTFTSNGPCVSTASTHVTITTIPTTQFVYNGPYCQKGTNPAPTFIGTGSGGVFTATPSGLVFSSSGAGVIDLAQSQPGTYNVTNTIAAMGGCPASNFSTSVTIDPAPTVNAGPNQTVSAGTVVQLAGSSNAASVTWSGGSGSFSNPASATATYTPAAGETSAILTLTTNDPPGACGPQSASVTITFTSGLASPTAAGASVCSGSSATLTATAPGGNYQWFSAATGGTLLATGAIFNTPALTVTTNYYVQTTLNGATSARTQVTVTVNSITAPVAQPGSGCSGSAATLTASGSTGTYQWYDAATGGNLLSTSATYTTPLLIADTAFYVQATVNGCITPRTRVTVKANPVPTITSADAVNTCSGTSVNYAITADVASNYTWSRGAVAGISNPAVSNQTSATITEALINTTTSPIDVTYTITPLSANNCTGTVFNLVVTVYPPSVVTSPAVQAICNNTSPNYTIQFNAPPNSYTWSRAAVTGISNPSVANQAAPTIREVLNNTTNHPIDVKYTFTINTNSCPASNFDYVVTVNPTTSITSAQGITICSGTPLNYTITSNVSGTTFIWSRNANADISNPAVANQTSNTINETLINTSTHTVFAVYLITPYINGCAGNAINYIVTIKGQPVTPVIISNSPVCLNSTIKLNTVTVEGATYNWAGPNGFLSSAQNPTINNVTKANAGTYTLTETVNGCTSAVSSVEVAVDDPPIANAGANQTVCTNVTAVNLNGIISGGTTTGVWATSGTGTFSPANNVLNAQYIPSDADKASGNVTLTLVSTSKDDCTIASSSITITLMPAPIANAGGNRDVCSQDVSVKLTGTSQFSNHVLWTSNGSGRFSTSDTLLVTNYTPSSADINKGSVTFTLQASSATCSSTTNQAIIRFVPPPTISAGLDRYVLKGQTITVSPTTSDANVHYLWTPNTYLSSDTVKNPIATGVQDITYTLKVTDARGCVSQDEVVIRALDPVNPPNTFTPNGDGRNDLWVIAPLDRYPGVTVDIYTRDGRQVFHSEGYGTPWDGTYGGQPVAVGVYYYMINTHFNNIKLSGYVTVIR